MWIWHAAVVAEYQKPLSLLGSYPDLELTLLVPRRWPERAGQMVSAEDPGNVSYRLVRAHALFTGFYYIYFFPSLLYQLLRYRPDIIYCYEEAHTFIAALVLTLRSLFLPESRVLLYAAQNIKKRYPIPFRLFESYAFRHTDGILACGTRVAETLRSKGYRRLLKVVALPTDACVFSPDREKGLQARRDLTIPEEALVIGYAGKLVEEKGLRILWLAFAQLACERDDVHLALAGGGPLMQEIQALACEAGLQERVHLPGVIHNSALPAFMNALNIFVLPSETRRNWREQFGRVAVEAMSCGVPVVGSDSGEIPTILDDAGLIFPEGDSAALLEQLRRLLDPAQRAHFAGGGRQRVLSLFTTARVAAQHYALYERLGRRGYEL